MTLFKRRDIEQYTDSLVDYLPGGILFASKSVQNSNFRRLLKGLAGELFRSNGLLKTYNDEIIPDQTVKFIGEWEQALGIPDVCFKATGIIAERRRDILTKLASLGIQTKQDFIDVAAIFGISVSIESGSSSSSFPLLFPVTLFNNSKQARFTIIIIFTVSAASRFTYIFPLLFGSGEIAILECLFQRLKPSNCNLIFKQI